MGGHGPVRAPPEVEPVPVRQGRRPCSCTGRDVRETTAKGEAQSASQLLATYADLLPADLANTLLDLPEPRMLEVAEELSDDRLADVLEEMPESEQVGIINHLGDARAADVLDQMQPDDAADLIAQLPDERGEALLDLMQPEEADDVRFLLLYAPGHRRRSDDHRADHRVGRRDGGRGARADPPPRPRSRARCRHLRDPAALRAAHRPVPRHGALPADAALPAARAARHPDRPEPRARAGQRLAPPRWRASWRATTSSPFPSSTTNHRLVGVVTIDDVLDYLLPDDWRSHDEDEPARLIRADTSPLTIAEATGRRNVNGRVALKSGSTPPRVCAPRSFPASENPATGSAASPRASPARWALRGSSSASPSSARSGSPTTCSLPARAQFDSAANGFTALTLMLSLQASYAAPLILLAQNRQDDRDRVQIEQDRQRAERNLADTEYLAREVVALRLACATSPASDFIRAELRALLEELDTNESSVAE